MDDETLPDEGSDRLRSRLSDAIEAIDPTGDAARWATAVPLRRSEGNDPGGVLM
jgi:hypothetical protein